MFNSLCPNEKLHVYSTLLWGSDSQKCLDSLWRLNRKLKTEPISIFQLDFEGGVGDAYPPLSHFYRPKGKVMFSLASVILFTIGLVGTGSLLILVGSYGAVGTHPTEMLSCHLVPSVSG